MHNKLGVDVPTKSAGNVLYRRLGALKTTLAIQRPMQYRFGGLVQSEHFVILTTTQTVDELEDWLDKARGTDSIGVFQVPD